MRFSTRFIVVASVLLGSALVWGQPESNASTSVPVHTPVLVRMSFTSSWVADYDFASPHICLSVDRAGRYQMRRVRMKNGDKEYLYDTPKSELLQGTLPPNELEKLERFLDDPEFWDLTGTAAGILRKGAETFVAEVPRENGVQRVVVSDIDNEKPFPRSVNRIVDWLQHFKAEGAKPLDVSVEDICPSITFQPLRPTTAWLEPNSSFGACVRR